MQRDKRKADIKTREDLKITDRFLMRFPTVFCFTNTLLIVLRNESL